MSHISNDSSFYEKLFHLLWLKPEIFKKTDILLNLPDTIFFENSHPLFWYYSNTSGVVRKRKQENITKEKILQKFTQTKNESGVIAYFIKENSLAEKKKISFFLHFYYFN